MANNLDKNGKPFEVLQAALQGEFEVQGLDVPQYPLFLAYAAPVAEGITGLKPRLPAGRGLTQAEALSGAAAEALELRASLARNIPKGRHQFEMAGGHDYLQVRCLRDGSTISVPAQQIFLDYAAHAGEKLLFDADSTGCAAGPTAAAAFQRGVLECIERDALATWWYGRQSRPALPLSVVDAAAPRVSWWIARRDRQTRLIDITFDVKVPCVAAVSSNRAGTDIAIGSAAALSTQAAALSAVLEMLQTEVSMQHAAEAGEPELARWQAEASTRSMPQFAPRPDAAIPFEIAPQQLLSSLSAAGYAAYGIELTLAGDPVASVRVLVPGFSALNRRINAARIAALCGLSGHGEGRFEVLEPY
jgi:ribosomal protein S12 methylthiotransferase accessory factor